MRAVVEATCLEDFEEKVYGSRSNAAGIAVAAAIASAAVCYSAKGKSESSKEFKTYGDGVFSTEQVKAISSRKMDILDRDGSLP